MVAISATYNPKFDQRRDVLKNLQRRDMKKEKGKRCIVGGEGAPEERHVYRNKAPSSIPNPLIRDGKAKKGESPPASPTELFWRE
jgi:hypothetical protein